MELCLTNSVWLDAHPRPRDIPLRQDRLPHSG